jgi:hypothetical protein
MFSQRQCVAWHTRWVHVLMGPSEQNNDHKQAPAVMEGLTAVHTSDYSLRCRYKQIHADHQPADEGQCTHKG